MNEWINNFSSNQSLGSQPDYLNKQVLFIYLQIGIACSTPK